jgi:hypothetical protein
MSDALILKTALGEGREVPAALQGLPTEIDGEPVRYRRKALLKVGKYRHPKLGELEFTRADLDAIARGTREFITDGGRVYVPPGHKPYDKALNFGWLLDPAVEGDTLYGTAQLIGTDAHREAARNDVSVCVRKDFVGGNGKKYPRVLEHLALCPDPVAMGLGDFVPLSRDSGPAEAVPVYMAATTTEPTMDLSKIRKALGVADDVPDADVLTQAEARISGQAAAIEAATKPLNEQVTALSRERDTLNGKVTELSRTPTPPDPEVLRDRADLTAGRIDLAVARGDVPAVIAPKLKELLGKPDAPNAYMLSRADGFNDRPADAILKLFEGSQLGRKSGDPETGVQLSRRETGDGADDSKPVTTERRNELRELAGLAPVAK